MPLKNIPKALQPKYEACVKKVKASGRNVNPYAVCYASVVGSGVADAARKRLANKKGG